MEMQATRMYGDHAAVKPETEEHQTGDRGELEHLGKKSVLKKVKEKAKKLKEAIGKKKHHEHGQPHAGRQVGEHRPPLDFMEEEKEEEEEEEEAVLGADRVAENLLKDVVNWPLPGADGILLPGTGESRPFDADPGIQRIEPGLLTPYMQAVAAKEPVYGSQEAIGVPHCGKASIESRPFDEDLAAKTSEPGFVAPITSVEAATSISPRDAGGRSTDQKPEARKDTDLSHVLEAMKDLKVNKELSTGSHDQFVPEPAATESNDQPSDEREQVYGPTFQSKVASAVATGTAVLTEKAASARDAIAAMLSYSGEGSNMASGDTAAASADESHRQKIADSLTEELAPVFDEVAGAKEAVTSRMEAKRDDVGVSATTYVMEKLSPGEEDRALLDVINDVIHTPTDGDQGGQAGKESEAAAAGSNGKGMVQKVKEAVTSLVGKNQEDQSHVCDH